MHGDVGFSRNAGRSVELSDVNVDDPVDTVDTPTHEPLPLPLCTGGRARKKTESLCSKTPTGARALRHMCQEAAQSLNHSTLDGFRTARVNGVVRTHAHSQGGPGGP